MSQYQTNSLKLFEHLKQKAADRETDKRDKELDARLRSFTEKQSQRLAGLVRLTHQAVVRRSNMY
jgi:hypothetical protein